MTNAMRNRRGDLTGQLNNQPLTKYIVSGFSFLARFLLGFGGFYDNWDRIVQRSVEVNPILYYFKKPMSPVLDPKQMKVVTR